MDLKRKPYSLFLYLAALVIIASFFQAQYFTADNPQEKYRAFTFGPSLLVIAGSLILTWMLYKLTSTFLYSLTLIWVHIAATCLAAAMLVITIYQGEGFVDAKPAESIGFTLSLTLPVGLLILGLLVYLINLVNGMLNTLKS